MSGALEVGTIVYTPRGLLARVTSEDSDERLCLTYLPVGEVKLFAELVQPLDATEQRMAVGSTPSTANTSQHAE